MFVLKSAAVFCMALPLAAIAAPDLIPSPTEKLYIPHGFDNNDNVEVIVSGKYPSTCYKTASSQVQLDESTKTIRIFPQTYEYTDSICALMIVPFVQSIKLGTLEAGTYQVFVGNNPSIAPKTLYVKPSIVNTPDDFMYAPVDAASIETDSQGKQSIVLSGRYPFTKKGCTIINEVKTNTDAEDTVVVQPVMEFLDSDSACAERNWKPTFQYRKVLTTPLAKGEYLMHVRVLNGNSFNKLELIE